MKARQFHENYPSSSYGKFSKSLFSSFCLASRQDAAEQLHHPDLSEKSLRLEIFFQFLLEQVQVTEVIVLGERQSNVQIDKIVTVAKNLNFF